MDLLKVLKMKSWFLYGLLNAVIGLIAGVYLMFLATGDGYEGFVYAAPIAVFITGAFFWKKLITEEASNLKIVFTGLLTGTVSHYLAFILMSIGMNICYWTTGGCLNSLGEPPASILSMLGAAIGFSFFSLIFFGWITAPGAIIIGFIIKWLSGREMLK